jgi:serine/threonine-protein kinase
MRQHATILRPGDQRPDSSRVSSFLPPDLLDQVRGRVRLLTTLLAAAFSFDLLLFYGAWIAATLSGRRLPEDLIFAASRFQWLNLSAVLASAALWWVARSRRFSAARLVDLGLVYEVAICFIISIATYWQLYHSTKTLPNLTWVPAIVIFFPLILPGPPRRMLAAAIVAGAMGPLGLLLLDRWGKVEPVLDSYMSATVGSAFAVVFAYMGARVIYGLGREVAAARELGSYHLEERLGEGGMGEVWRARHRMLARPAAIKLIRRSLVGNEDRGISDDAVRRFEREAQVIASLKSPHTVELFDFGVSDGGTLYYVMELLDGLDADTLVRRFGPLPAERAIHILRQVCHSLSEAESRDLVHRDIKPANVFLCRYGEEYDFVKVLDFGLVKTLDEPAGAAPPITMETAIRGTPAFIAPEQALGGKVLDGRADIYATGCVAYWLLTGELVFTGETPMELVIHHARTPPTPPSARTEIQIPEALDRLVLACLAKDPNERPQTAKELSRRLADVGVGNAWTEERAREWWERHLAPPRHPAPPAEHPGGSRPV